MRSAVRLLFHSLSGRVGVRLKLDVQGQRGGKISDLDGQGRVGVLENCTIFMDIICVSSLKWSSEKLGTFLKNTSERVYSSANFQAVGLRLY